MHHLHRLALAGLFALAAGSLRADDFAGDQVTYAKQVATILNKHCVMCHRPGQIGPMSLLTFKDIRPWVKSIKKVVQDKSMPPWYAHGAAPGTFANDPSLSEEEIQKIVAWTNQGAPLGDPLDMPPTPTFRDDLWQIGKPNEVFTMTRAFKMGDDVADHYQNVIVPTNLKEDKWVTKIELRPGNNAIVHHILAFIIPPGAAGELAAQTSDIAAAALGGGGLLSKYAPGNNPDTFPPGYGKKIPAGAKILFQMHYHKDAGPGTAALDQSSMGVIYADGPVENPVTTAWIVNPILNIPPNKDNYRSVSNFTFQDDGYIQSLFPHMHYRGKAFKFEATYPDGKTETLLDVPVYRFDWQLSYFYKEKKFIPKGTKIRATGVFDNTSSNSFNPDPNRNVTWGEATTDEMMLGLMDYSYVNLKKEQGMIGLPDGLANMLPPELQGLANGKGGDVSKLFK